VFSCERLSHSADEITYRLILSNRFSALHQYRTSRLFQNQNIPDIIASLLRKHGYAGRNLCKTTPKKAETHHVSAF